ncbi:MAG: Ig-like domain-containing protein, partial [Clostridia bacterium]|nr:Ig-like domain-containing protein [Clostridia bacterium]
TPVRVIDAQAAEGTNAGGDVSEEGKKTDAYDSEVYIKNAVKIAAGKNHSAAIADSFDKSDPDRDYNDYKFVYTWGSNAYGQSGDDVDEYGEYKVKKPYPLAYGDSNGGYAYPPRVDSEILSEKVTPADTNLCGIIDIACGDRHTLFLREDGVVLSLGDHTKGQHGRGLSTRYENVVTRAGVSNLIPTTRVITSIAANGDSSMLLDEDGRVYTFGDNSYGQHGTGTKDTDSHNLPTSIVNNALASYNTSIKRDSKAIGLGANSGYVMREDGYLYAFGRNSEGQLGEMSREDRIVPVRVGSVEDEILTIDVTLPGAASAVQNPNVVNVTKGQTVQIGTNGTLTEMRGFNLIVEDNPTFANRSLTFSSSDNRTATVDASGKVTALARGTVVIKAATTSNVTSQITNGSKSGTAMFVLNIKEYDESDPEPTDFYTEPMVAGGNDFSIALKSNGTVWTWGSNDDGQLGNGVKSAIESGVYVERKQYLPVQVETDLDGNPIEKIIAVAAGENHAVALREDGKVYAWGSNSHGQIGNGKSGVDQAVEDYKNTDPHDAIETEDGINYYIYEPAGLLQVNEIIQEREPLQTIVDESSVETLRYRFHIMADLDMSGIDFAPINTISKPASGFDDGFRDEFYGNGHRISHLTIKNPDNFVVKQVGDYKVFIAAMFAYNYGIIDGLILSDVEISNTVHHYRVSESEHASVHSYAAAIVGINETSETMTGSITRSAVYSGSISSFNRAASIAVENKGKIENVYNRANIIVDGSQNNQLDVYAGGSVAINLNEEHT